MRQIRCGYLSAQKNNILACHFKNEPAISSSILLDQGNGVCSLESDVLSLKGFFSAAAGYLGFFRAWTKDLGFQWLAVPPGTSSEVYRISPKTNTYMSLKQLALQDSASFPTILHGDFKKTKRWSLRPITVVYLTWHSSLGIYDLDLSYLFGSSRLAAFRTGPA